MLRSLFITLSKLSWAQKFISNWGFAWKLAARFVAGENLSAAINVVSDLNQKGMHATLDFLGEHAINREVADQAVLEVQQILTKIEERGLKCNVSIKLTQLGLLLDEEFCFNNLLLVLAKAREKSNFIRIDMEDSSFTEMTLKILLNVMDQGYLNVGIVIQSALYRSENDVRMLLQRNIPIRMVKGAYREPENVAYPRKSDVDMKFDLLTQMILEAARHEQAPHLSKDGRFPPLPAIASHDSKRIVKAQEYATQHNLPSDRFEFQMLYGIRRDLQQELTNNGYAVRVYVPYGTHWYPYFMRRLAERPANVWFLVANLFR